MTDPFDTPTDQMATEPQTAEEMAADPFDDKKLLEMWKKKKQEAFDQRWILERDWIRNLYYVANRQWIHWDNVQHRWVPKRLSRDVPRPVTNMCRTAVITLRAAFGAIDLGVRSRPVGNTSDAITTANIADEMSPLIHADHDMDRVLRESDFWLLVTGTSMLHMTWNKDKESERSFVPYFQCTNCGTIVEADVEQCPTCGNTSFDKALNEDGSEMGELLGVGSGQTEALSPFEFAVPPHITRFADANYVIRTRWRDKSYYEANYPDVVKTITFGKSPSDRSMQVYKGLALLSDLGRSTVRDIAESTQMGGEGVTEYEFWMKPTSDFPEGVVFRIVGDEQPVILHSPNEGLPGPLPFKDIQGNYLWPFAMSTFEPVGGRFYGYSLLDSAIQKQDQLNQIDSHLLMILQNMSNPVWLMPRGVVDIQEMNGTPGGVIRYNAAAAAGVGVKPERLGGENVPESIYRWRELVVKEFENITGVFDILER